MVGTLESLIGGVDSLEGAAKLAADLDGDGEVEVQVNLIF